MDEKITLRPYQSEAVELLSHGFKLHKRQVLCLPTGAGKTVTFSEIIKRSALKGTSTLVLTHRQELFKQTFAAVAKNGFPIQEINAETTVFYPDALINIAMVETLNRRLSKGIQINPKLIIIDEAHYGNFNKIIELYPDAYIIGVTATPIGKHFYKYYTNIVQNIDVPDLIEQGYICDYRAFQMKDDFSDLKTKAGEFTDQSLFNHFNKKTLYNGVIDKWIEKTNGKKTVIFNCNVEHSDQMAFNFNQSGIKSYSITSKTTKREREQILEAYENNQFQVLNNCGILTTGWDCPSVEVVVLNRATQSESLFLQMCGRGSRIHTGKELFTCLDFGANHDRHLFWNDERKRELKPPKKKKEGPAPTKTCPKCDAQLPASTKECNFCGHIFDVKESELKDGEMVEITKFVNQYKGNRISELQLNDLINGIKSKKLKHSFVWRVVRSRGKGSIKEFAQLMKYSNGWIYRQELQLNDVEYNDFYIK